MTTFTHAMNSVTEGYLTGAMQNVVPDEQAAIVRAALDDAFRSGFQAGFVLARTEPNIEAPKTAIYRKEQE